MDADQCEQAQAEVAAGHSAVAVAAQQLPDVVEQGPLLRVPGVLNLLLAVAEEVQVLHDLAELQVVDLVVQRHAHTGQVYYCLELLDEALRDEALGGVRS